jgi:hypothetical protein
MTDGSRQRLGKPLPGRGNDNVANRLVDCAPAFVIGTTPHAQRSEKAYHGLCAVALWSTVASAFKISLTYFEPVQLLLVAACTSTLTLG